MSIPYGCPYQVEDGFDDRNRFPHDHLLVGEIENGKRYPFGVYTKEEADERYAIKKTEEDLATLTETVNTKAAQSEVTALVETVAGKADESECIAIRARLDALEDNKIRINTFTATPAVCEIGSSNTIVLNWSLSKTPTAQTINEYPVSGTSQIYYDISTAQTYTLSVTDGEYLDTATLTVDFANNIYYGAASDLTAVTTLASVLSNTKARTIDVNAGAGQYIIYALPVRLGTVEFFVSGFEGGFEPPARQQLTNASGYTEAYYVYRSTNANLGRTIVEVREG